MRIGLLQINPIVGDLAGNARRIAEAARQAAAKGAHLLVAPELSLVGYLPRDLLLSPAFVARSRKDPSQEIHDWRRVLRIQNAA